MRFNQFTAPAVILAAFSSIPLVASLAVNTTTASAPSNYGESPSSYNISSAIRGSWWQENIQHQGIAAFNPDRASYKVWRNVKDYGAVGDGSTDDTNAINRAISEGNRCGRGCDSSTITPALIYFPAGTYLVSRPIVAMYYSQLVGDPTNRPTLKGAPNFAGIGIVDSDPYDENGQNWYTNQNNFFRSVRNFVFDTTSMPASAGTALHWQVAQATSLVNLHFRMSQAPGNLHQGIFMDNGSGGFMSDLSFEGGAFGMWIGNQQFMTRNLKFTNCRTSIYLNWDWVWTFKSVSIDGGEIGLDISSNNGQGSQSVGSVILLDSEIKNVPIGVRTARNAGSSPAAGGSALLDNVKLVNVGTAVASTTGGVILGGGSTTIDLWGQGHVYSPSGQRTVVQGPLSRQFPKPAVLLDGSGRIFEKSRPIYVDTPLANVISVRSQGARGDGTTDDTATLKRIFQTYGGNPNNVIYFDHGHYLVTDTITVPVNTKVVGEAWAVIMAGGSSKWKDPNNPAPVLKIGNPGDQGLVELSELLLQTQGPQPGAIMLQWNSRDRPGQQGENGMWDVHIRVAGSAGTQLEVAQCEKDPQNVITQENHKKQCEVAFMLIHITDSANVYIENSWAWTSDHALDRPFTQITVYNARGILIETTNPVWMYAAASEHNTLYQYQLQGAKNIFMATIQSETPYFQENPVATVPFSPLSAWNDPTYAACTTNSCRKSWALRVLDSQDVLIYGAGLYSFFQNYNQDCVEGQTCQDDLVEVDGSTNFVVYALNTVGARNMVNYEGNKIVPSGENVNAFSRTIIEFAV